MMIFFLPFTCGRNAEFAGKETKGLADAETPQEEQPAYPAYVAGFPAAALSAGSCRCKKTCKIEGKITRLL
jgi:hypothetical protein